MLLLLLLTVMQGSLPLQRLCPTATPIASIGRLSRQFCHASKRFGQELTVFLFEAPPETCVEVSTKESRALPLVQVDGTLLTLSERNQQLL
jgi:hypothetical protein